MRWTLAILALATGATALPVSAETLAVGVRRPPAATGPYMLRGLSVDRFTGADGRTMALAVERAVARLRDGSGKPLFAIFEAGAGEGAINGRADAQIDELRIQQVRRFCPDTRDPKARCDDKLKQEAEVQCRKRVIDLSVDVRVVRGDDGRVLYSRDFPAREEAVWCPGDNVPQSAEGAIGQMLNRAAEAFAGDLAPYAAVDNIRIREDRKGLTPEAAEAFKVAVRTTKTSGSQACAMFAALAQNAPDQRSLAYNMALCAEARGDYDEAIRRYRAMGSDRDAAAGADRAAATQAHDEMERQRNGSRR